MLVLRVRHSLKEEKEKKKPYKPFRRHRSYRVQCRYSNKTLVFFTPRIKYKGGLCRKLLGFVYLYGDAIENHRFVCVMPCNGASYSVH